MREERTQATDGRTLIHIQFERESPDADTPTIEVVYVLRFPEDVTLAAETRVLIFLSSTRVDTREVIQLAPEEERLVLEKASDFAASLTREW